MAQSLMHDQSHIVDQASRLRELALRNAGIRPSGARVLAVTSGKGGVGKSTVALNVGVALRDLGRRVLLVDADENLAGLDVMMNVAPAARLGDVMRGRFSAADVIVPVEDDLALLPGSSGDPRYPRRGPAAVRRLVEQIRTDAAGFDRIVIDTGAGIANDVLAFALAADETLVVTTPEPTAIMDAYAMIKCLVAEKPMLPISFIVNRSADPREADASARKLQTAIAHFLRRDVRYAGFIPEDRQAAQAVAAQQPLLRRSPGAPSALSIRQLARTHEEYTHTIQQEVAA